MDSWNQAVEVLVAALVQMAVLAAYIALAQFRRELRSTASHGFAQSQMAPLEREVAAHGAYVDAVLKRRGVPKRERPDFVQYVLMSALEAIRSGRYQPRPGIALRHWLGAIARHLAGRFTRSYGREELYDPSDTDWKGLTPAPDIAMEQCEVWNDVVENLKRDPGGDMLVAHYLDGIPMRDVARLLEIPASTAYRRRAEALERLRRALGRRGKP